MCSPFGNAADKRDGRCIEIRDAAEIELEICRTACQRWRAGMLQTPHVGRRQTSSDTDAEQVTANGRSDSRHITIALRSGLNRGYGRGLQASWQHRTLTFRACPEVRVTPG